MIGKFQAGGQAPSQEEMLQQVAQLIQQQGPEKAAQTLVQSGVPQDQAVAIIKQVIQMMQGGPQAARHGAKLTYIKSLIANCPKGTELKFYKKGGAVCPVCEKKMEKACKGKKMKNGDVISRFKAGRKC